MLEVEPDIHLEELTKVTHNELDRSSGASTSKQCDSSLITTTSSVNISTPVQVSHATSSTGEAPTTTITSSPSSTGSNITGSSLSEDRGEALVRIYDTDPAIFSSNERLKVGVMRRESIDQNSRFQCQYCVHSCEAAIALKMHVRLKHMPVLVYDNSNKEKINNDNSNENTDANGHGVDDIEVNDTRLRMGVRLQNISSDHTTLNDKPFVCLFCECAYKLQCYLQSHFRDQHSPNMPFQCPSCEEKFRRNVELTRHKIYRCIYRKGHKLKKI